MTLFIIIIINRFHPLMGRYKYPLQHAIFFGPVPVSSTAFLPLQCYPTSGTTVSPVIAFRRYLRLSLVWTTCWTADISFQYVTSSRRRTGAASGLCTWSTWPGPWAWSSSSTPPRGPAARTRAAKQRLGAYRTITWTPWDSGTLDHRMYIRYLTVLI